MSGMTDDQKIESLSRENDLLVELVRRQDTMLDEVREILDAYSLAETYGFDKIDGLL